MYCTNCGAEILEGANFCTGCGRPLSEAAAGAPAQKDKRKRRRFSPKAGIIYLVVLFLALRFVASFTSIFSITGMDIDIVSGIPLVFLVILLIKALILWIKKRAKSRRE